MPRLRLGVALLVPPPHDVAVDALRRAVGDPALGRIPAHLTLVPPVNVREDRLDDALTVLRRAAAAVDAFELGLGPPTTFLPVNPVLYLPVTRGADQVTRLRDAVFVDPLARPLTWPFVPHVTLADDASPERIVTAQAALAGYEVEFPVKAVHLLQEGPERAWQPIADASLGPPAVIGPGGLELQLTRSERPEPGVMRALDAETWSITARRATRPVGLATGRIIGADATIDYLVVADGERGEGIGTQLVAAAEALAAERGCARIVSSAPAGSRLDAFLAGRGWHGSQRTLS